MSFLRRRAARSSIGPLYGLSLTQVATPVAQAGWTRVRLRAASLNPHDVGTLRGVGHPEERLPIIRAGCGSAQPRRPRCQISRWPRAVTPTTTPMGRALYGIVAVFAQLRVDTIRDNTQRGLHFARSQGRNGGRPSVMTADRIATAKQLRAEQRSWESIGRVLGVGASKRQVGTQRLTLACAARGDRIRISRGASTDLDSGALVSETKRP